MALKVAVQMDPIDRIDISGDSTFAMMLEAERRGHEQFYYSPQQLALDEGKLVARGSTVNVADKRCSITSGPTL